jgi:hypothetical protein
MNKLDYTKIHDVEIDGIDHGDYPDYCDAYVDSATYEYEPGKFRELTDQELEQLNMDSGFVHEHVWEKLI